MPSKPNFPLELDDVSAHWLSSQLARDFEGAKVNNFSVTQIGQGEGFMATLGRVDLEGQSVSGPLPESVIVKLSSPMQATRDLATRMNYYGREIGFYQDCASDCGVRVPRCYSWQAETLDNRFSMLLEDLAPAVPVDQVQGCSFDESAKVMRAFADLHAHWWNSPKLKSLSWPSPITHVQPVSESLALLEASILDAEVTGRFDAYPNMKRLLPRLPNLCKIEPPPPFPYTLVHGDLRSDNIFFPEGEPEPIIIDWQTCGMGQPMTDIARWLTQSIDIETRRGGEEALLSIYHERLLERGVKGYTHKAMMSEYQLNLVVTLLMFSMSMDEIDQSSERAAPLFHAMYSRLEAALEDWDVEKILKILPLLIPIFKITTWFKLKFHKEA